MNPDFKSKWIVSGHFIFDVEKSSENEHRVAASLYWHNRIDDFTSIHELNIEGYGRPSFSISKLSKRLSLLIDSQNFQTEYFGEEGFPIDHFVSKNSWIPLIEEEMNQYRKFLEDHNLDLGDEIEFPQYLTLLKAKMDHGLNVDFGTYIPSFDQNLGTKSKKSSLSVKPYKYQEKGIEWLCALRVAGVGGILGDEMGLGKTLQILGLIDYELQSNPQAKILIVVPASLRLNWESEFAKFLPSVSVYVHSGQFRFRRAEEFLEKQIVLTTYPILNRDAVLLHKCGWTLIACDEAHNMKNPNSITRSSLLSLRNSCIFLSTGTPLENNLLDLWSLIDLIRPGLMGPEMQMRDMLENQFAEASRVAELVRPLIMRRKVSAVLPDLPELVEKVHWIEPGRVFIDYYEDIRQNAKNLADNISQLAVITSLRRFCTYPPMACSYPNDVPDAKVDLLLDILEAVSEKKEKVIIFTSWHDSADFLNAVVQSAFENVYSDVIDGRETSEIRFPRIQEFQSVNGFAILICNTRAAGEGLNITAANHVIHFDRQWNPAKEAQATARAHRNGQLKTVFVHKLVYKGTIEEVIDNRLILKSHLAAESLHDAEEEEDMKSVADALGIRPSYVDDGV